MGSWWRRGEHGGMTLEVALLAPIFIALLSLMFGLGRFAGIESAVDQAARDAARSATAKNSAREADRVEDLVMEETLEGSVPDACLQSAVLEHAMSENAFDPTYVPDPDDVSGEWYQVTVSCTLDLSDIGVFFLPNDVTIRQSFTSPLDVRRSFE